MKPVRTGPGKAGHDSPPGSRQKERTDCHPAHKNAVSHELAGKLANRTLAYVSPAAVRHNLAGMRRRLAVAGSLPRVWAVVKADAYGHGIELVLPGLCDADGLMVADIEQLYRCRRAGWSKPIMLMHASSGVLHLGDPDLYPLHLVVDSLEHLAWLKDQFTVTAPVSACVTGAGAGHQLPFIWLRHAGSLNLAGLQAADYRRAYQMALEMQQQGLLRGPGHMQHYAHAEDAASLHEERLQFKRLIHGLPGPICSENSAALLAGVDYASQCSWIRTGIALYGISPFAIETGTDLGLVPAMRLESCLYAIQHLSAGDTIGYGCTFRAPADMRIGLVLCGYSCGYPRNISAAARALMHGKACAIVGRISMEMLAIDLGPVPAARKGDRVVLWGDPALPVEAVARWAGTIPAQLCVGLTGLVPRRLCDYGQGQRP